MLASTRIILNTLSAYARLCVLALVGILATPIALRVLGASDYGIFSVIGGSLAFLMFINGALTTSAQRHIAYSIGEGSKSEAAKWFGTSLVVHMALGVLFATVAMLASHWILFSLLHFPAGRIGAAVWIYRMVVTAMVFNVVSTPYQALMMAHESIFVLSFISMASALTTIGGVLMLRHFPGDLLIWYAVIYCFSQVILFISPAIYSLFKYEEARRFNYSAVRRADIAELLSFSGWNLFGALSAVVRSQGPAILLNVFVGSVANAAYGLAIQVNGFSSEISWGVLRATTSPIVKRHAAGDQRGMAALANLASKYAFFILWIVIAPVLFEIGFCLKLWLHRVPPHTEAFVSLLLATLLVDQLTSGFGAALQATGRIKAYQIIVGGMNCVAVPIGYVLLKFGMPVNSILWAGLCGAILAGVCRLRIAQVQAGISGSDWFRTVALPSLFCILGTSAAMLALIYAVRPGAPRFVGVVILNVAVGCAILWRTGVSQDHQMKLKALASQTVQKVTGLFSMRDRAKVL